MNKIEIYNSVNKILVNDDQKYDKLNPKGSDNLIEKINKIFRNCLFDKTEEVTDPLIVEGVLQFDGECLS